VFVLYREMRQRQAASLQAHDSLPTDEGERVSGRELTLAKEGRRGDGVTSVRSNRCSIAARRGGRLKPGEWDCENRDDILRTLRERHEQGFARGEVELLDGGPDAVIVVSRPRVIGGEA
jgi:hypothetical protein